MSSVKHEDGLEYSSLEALKAEYGREQQVAAAAERVAASLRRALIDVFRGHAPTTVVGYLMSHSQPTTVYDIAGEIGVPVDDVERSVSDLEADDLAITIREDGLDKVVRFAAFSRKNQ